MRIFESEIWQIVAWPLSLFYRGVIFARNRLYDLGGLRTFEAEAFVISIGNITAGGNGKTPAVISLAQALHQRGYRVAILSRGYGRRSKGAVVVSAGTGPIVSEAVAGDEPYLMAVRLPGIPVVVDENRVRGAALIVKKFGATVILLDDGFQHRRLGRACDIVLLGEDFQPRRHRLLPAGNGREPINALRRATQLWMLTSDASPGATSSDPLPGEPAVKKFAARIATPWLLDPARATREPSKHLAGRLVFAVAGIARPERFVRSLEAAGAKIADKMFFADHKAYQQHDLLAISRRFRESGADWLVTTEKDWVKLVRSQRFQALPIRVLRLDLSIAEEALRGVVSQIDSYLRAR